MSDIGDFKNMVGAFVGSQRASTAASEQQAGADERPALPVFLVRSNGFMREAVYKSDVDAALAHRATTAADQMTERKTQQIGIGGMTRTGYILQDDTGRACIVHQGAVRWLSNAELWNVAHPAADQQGDTASASGWEGLPPIGERESIMDVCGLPKLMRAIIETKGSPDSLARLYDFVDAWGDARFKFAQQGAEQARACDIIPEQRNILSVEWRGDQSATVVFRSCRAASAFITAAHAAMAAPATTGGSNV